MNDKELKMMVYLSVLANFEEIKALLIAAKRQQIRHRIDQSRRGRKPRRADLLKGRA